MASRGRGEEGARTACVLANSFVLRAVECLIIFRIMSSSSACSDTSHVRSVRGIAILALHWLDSGVIQVHDQILIDGVLVWTLGVANGRDNLVHASGLGAPVVRSDAVILANLPVLLVILQIDALVSAGGAMLYCVVVNGVVPDLVCVLHRRSDDLIELPALLLLRVQRSCHIQILFLVVRDVRAWRLID